VSDFAQREWRFYLDDMIGFAEQVIAYMVKRSILLSHRFA